MLKFLNYFGKMGQDGGEVDLLTLQRSCSACRGQRWLVKAEGLHEVVHITVI